MLRIARICTVKGSLGRRLRSSLVETHESFLHLVKNHGEGEIQMVYHNSYVEIILNNTTKRNAISGKMMFQFASIVDTLVPASCSDLQNKYVGLLLRGAGIAAFSAGADLNLVKDIVNTPQRGGMMSEFMTDALNRLHQSNLVSVCVLNGPALGGGSELTTACDFRIMPSDPQMFVQFVHAKIGASPGWGGAYRLTKMVGRRDALRLIGTSPRVGAAEAAQIKYADQLIAPYVADSTSTLEPNADDYFREAGARFLQPYLDMQYPGSVRAIKQAVAAVDELETESARAVEKNIFRQRWGGSDNKSALKK